MASETRPDADTIKLILGGVAGGIGRVSDEYADALAWCIDAGLVRIEVSYALTAPGRLKLEEMDRVET
jgi:hypothetical protein